MMAWRTREEELMRAAGTTLLFPRAQHRAQAWLSNSAAVSSLTRQPAQQTLPTSSGASELVNKNNGKTVCVTFLRSPFPPIAFR